MIRLAPILSIALAACISSPPSLSSPDADVRPVVVQDRLAGRWAITAVNGKPAQTLWLELGGEGPANITNSNGAFLVDAPRPPTRAYLGCNDLHLNGWTRNGDKLTLGANYAHRTERGCDPATMALEDQAHAILVRTMTMELTPPDRLRLINEKGTLDLIRYAR